MRDKIWKIEKIFEGVYTTKIDKAFDELKIDFKTFITNLIHLGDSVQWTWQYMSLMKRIETKLDCYDMNVKSSKNVITIKLKRN